MNLVALIQVQAEEAPADLGLPTFVFGIIALVVFAALLMVLLSFRDVANRHSAGASNPPQSESTGESVQKTTSSSDD